jgi:hypothetical protein
MATAQRMFVAAIQVRIYKDATAASGAMLPTGFLLNMQHSEFLREFPILKGVLFKVSLNIISILTF